MPRRNPQDLERAIAAAIGRGAKARAHYARAVFHDNNAREREVIPHYRQALTIGLP